MDFSSAAKEPKTRPCTQRQAVRCSRSAASFLMPAPLCKHRCGIKKAVHLFGARLFLCGLYWIRTSDLCPVKAAL